MGEIFEVEPDPQMPDYYAVSEDVLKFKDKTKAEIRMISKTECERV